MSKIFTRTQYRLPSGRVIDLPLGVSLHEFPPPRNGIQVTVNLRGTNKTFSVKSQSTADKLSIALRFVVAEIDSGKIPGTCATDPTRGICTLYHRDTDSFVASVSYPCTRLGKMRRKEFYLGTTATRSVRGDAVYRAALAFREKMLTMYAKEFKRKVLDTIKVLETQDEQHFQ